MVSPDGRFAGLTPREAEVARFAATGLKTRTIARHLGVSPRTVDIHLSRVYRKLAVRGRAGLVAVGGPAVGAAPPTLTRIGVTVGGSGAPAGDTVAEPPPGSAPAREYR